MQAVGHSLHFFSYLSDEERTLKPRFEKYSKESGSLDSDGLWYGEGDIQEADSEEEDDDEEEQEELGLEEDDKEEAADSEVIYTFFSNQYINIKIQVAFNLKGRVVSTLKSSHT